MSKVLHIEASPRKQRSKSIEVAGVFIDSYKAANADDEVETLDLWSTDLPRFDGDVLNAKYAIMHGKDHTAEEAAAWQAIVDAFNHFNSADKYIFSLPMWNFGVPYVFKHYVDILAQPGLAFNVTPEGGYEGLVTGKPAVVIVSRGGEYPAGTPGEAFDFQKPYVDTFLKFIGFADVKYIYVEPMMNPEKAEAGVQAAKDLAKELAASF